ncbi:uncharacterized protein PAC_09875 [Phialocephala subalpina]|uniref:Uncharacterized protein n=1 Tax=Phialocephala subalpina TaxID=576137 RepID=A0A1L7X4P4_9HELO|nr:uncharacterized protein PAC_09875 [Phialocephala subalpina]
MPITTYPAKHGSEIMSPANRGWTRLTQHEGKNKEENRLQYLDSYDPAIPTRVTCPQALTSRVPKVNHNQRVTERRMVSSMHAPRPYFEHLHLVTRSDGVWLAILTQLNFYMLKHGEELRSMLVAHNGKERITVPINGKTGNSKNPLDFEGFVRNVTDVIIAFLGAMSKYFYEPMCATGCGLPSVTLLTFDEPEYRNIKAFWQRILHHQPEDSGRPEWCSGWLTAFSYWDDDGIRACRKSIASWASVNARVNDTYYGYGIYGIKMIAGSVGMEFEASGDHKAGLDTVKPLSGWWVYGRPLLEDTKLALGCAPTLATNSDDDKGKDPEILAGSRLQLIWEGSEVQSTVDSLSGQNQKLPLKV